MEQVPVAQTFQLKNTEVDNENLKKEIEANFSTSEEPVPLSNEGFELRTWLTNWTPKFLRKIEEKYWKGRSIIGAPHLAPSTAGGPRQTGSINEGVRWGIAYTDGENADDTTGRKWIVAFDTAARKAYAEAGPNGPIDWNVVEVKLGLSKDKVEYVDNILGGKAVAEISTDSHTAYGTFY